MGGTFDMPSALLIFVSTPGVPGWKAGVGERGGCTLLGPEGPGHTLVCAPPSDGPV